ncbi:MAG: helix-turn-helix transcriptional regulator [Mailhella sp.]|nr:helix-turn-helix transcriptional regulator [Mailhella sp.]
MKLTIGENIRKFRRKNDLTQEALAALLGVSYQSVSRWENGTTYPDLELIPAISALLSVTVDELLGMPQIEKEKRATATFDALRRECIRTDYDAKRIVSLLRDIRRNYLDSASAKRPFTEGNDRAFRDLVAEKGKVSKDMMNFLFGRPLMYTVIMFGIDARANADGSITLVQTIKATLKR